RGNFFVGENNMLPFNRPDRSETEKIVFDQEVPFDRANGVLATVHFKLKEENPGDITIDNLEAEDESGDLLELELRNIIEEGN
ncbi:MAG: hypothetical protein ACOCWN_05685, partial [Halanaerobium sp.]